MMKTFKYIILAFTTVFMVSCANFLEETPRTAVKKEGVYNSLSSARAALAGCYASIAGYNYTGFNMFHVLNVTSGLGVSIKANDVNLTTMNILASDVNITNAYNGMYETIRCTNDVIDGMKTSEITDEKERKRIAGEAYFIRALTYFNLVRMFGKITLVTEPVTSFSGAHGPREETSKIYSLIESDLNEAFNLLPEPADKVEGHPHRYAAKALLAKVYVTLAGDDPASEYWRQAYMAALDVYENGNYKLVRKYEDLFGSKNKNNSESIFEIQFSADVNSGRMTETTFPIGHPLMSNITSEGKSWGKTRPTQRAFAQFDEGDPRREASFVYESYTNIFEKQANKKNIILYPTTKKEGTASKLTYKQGDSEYAAWKKYYDPSMTASATNANFVFFRYSDLLLLLAEAANEINEPTAADYLNEVLDRARDADGDGVFSETEVYPMAFSGSKDELRERIFRERLKEFTGECEEWFTVRRRGETYLKKIMEEHNAHVDAWYKSQNIRTLPKYVYKYDITDETVKKNMLFPFPADEINTNENISQDDQNYGY